METQSFYDYLEKSFPLKNSRAIPSYKRALKDEYTSEAFRTYFLDFEGKAIRMPSMFMPSDTFLEKHREQLVS